MLHTSFAVEVLLWVMYYPNSFLEKKNWVKTRPGSDFSFMSYRKGKRNALCFGYLQEKIYSVMGPNSLNSLLGVIHYVRD